MQDKKNEIISELIRISGIFRFPKKSLKIKLVIISLRFLKLEYSHLRSKKRSYVIAEKNEAHVYKSILVFQG